LCKSTSPNNTGELIINISQTGFLPEYLHINLSIHDRTFIQTFGYMPVLRVLAAREHF
jgi:hypothetical protein